MFLTVFGLAFLGGLFLGGTGYALYYLLTRDHPGKEKGGLFK